jgi:hypothetical protein
MFTLVLHNCGHFNVVCSRGAQSKLEYLYSALCNLPRVDVTIDRTSIQKRQSEPGNVEAIRPVKIIVAGHAVATSLDERDVIEDVGLRREGNHAQLVVVKAIIDPDKRRIPIQFARQSQRNAMSGSVYRILRWVELDARALL